MSSEEMPGCAAQVGGIISQAPKEAGKCNKVRLCT